jgi:hypothetical protein
MTSTSGRTASASGGTGFRSRYIRISVLLACIAVSNVYLGGQEPREQQSIPIEKLFGAWQSEDDGSIVHIGPSQRGDNRSLQFKGKYDDWGGSYDGRQLTFIRHALADQMDDAAPKWARDEVERQHSLMWWLELTPHESCGLLSAKGQWFPGELSWREEKDPASGQVKREAMSLATKGKPLPVKYVKLTDDGTESPTLTGEPVILVRPGDRSMPRLPVQSLNKKESFFVELILPAELAAKQGKTVTVNLRDTNNGHTATLALEVFHQRGSVLYTTNQAVTFEKPFNIAGPSDLVNSPFDNINVESLKPTNGDSIVVSYSGADSQSFTVYSSWVQQGIAANEQAFQQERSLYESLLNDPKTSPADKEELHQKTQAILNAQTVIRDYHPDQGFNDVSRYLVGKYYHERLLDVWKADLSGSGVGSSATEWLQGKGQYNMQFNIVSTSTKEINTLAAAISDAHERNLNELFGPVMSGLALGMYQIVAQATGGDQIWVTFFGINSMGQPVDLTDRILSGTNLAFGALLQGAGSKFMADLSSSEARVNRFGASDSLKTGELLERYVHDDPRISMSSGPQARPVVHELDIAWLDQVYGENALLMPTPGETLPVQIDNSTCAIAVAQQMAREGGQGFVPEALLTEVLRRQGKFVPGVGTYHTGFESLIADSGGRWLFKKRATLTDISEFLSKGYMVRATVKPLSWPDLHSVRVREVVQHGGEDFFVIFDDPAFGRRVVLPACDFERVFNGDIHLVDYGQVHSP